MDWLSLLPQCLGIRHLERPLGAHNNVALHLSFYASQVLLFRDLISPATREARATPESSLRQWFSPVLIEFRSFASLMNALTEEDLEGFWIRRLLFPHAAKRYAAHGGSHIQTLGPADSLWQLPHLLISSGLHAL
ncbi:hypothetical protein BDV29DRAFT_135180 [Aspergillus leporis]|uniref:Uncharacterized protein n=1 Tax=Aspergillus leporis TaxID=41062 RepID=A0A5N5X273_9EURO|nr:hypothetical protein BDV29DRAFT_135180 [Aspergillus leporis]